MTTKLSFGEGSARTRRREPRILRGTGASDGIVIARALIYEKQDIPFFRVPLLRTEVRPEVDRFEAARSSARTQLERIRERAVKALGEDHAYIFDAQMLMLDDPLLTGRVVELIRTARVNTEWALKLAVDELSEVFEGLNDAYMRERRGDLQDVVSRLVRNIVGVNRRGLEKLERAYILLADDVRPSDTMQIDWDHTVGLAMEIGSRTYHTAILARSMAVPCVVGVEKLTEVVDHGSPLIMDGRQGIVIVDPDRDLLRDYRNRRKREQTVARQLERLKELPPQTKDGHRIVLQANIEFPQEAKNALKHGSAGIGLFRSEWFLSRSGGAFPGEEEQFEVYRDLAKSMKPASVIVRAFDISEASLNPDAPKDTDAAALGLRAVRLLLKHRELFTTQIRALLRARTHGNIKVMFPMVSGLEEWRNVIAVIEDAKNELKAQGTHFGDDLPCGLTLEVPAAAMITDLFAKEVDFISVGTNDLIQYLIGVDRENQDVAYLYQPFHPALVRTLSRIIQSAHDFGVKVGICGEVASDPLMIGLLIGLGVDELSMTPNSIPKAKKVIRSLTFEKAQEVARKALTLGTVAEVSELVQSAFETEIPKEIY